jgi:hypothetical protein
MVDLDFVLRPVKKRPVGLVPLKPLRIESIYENF